VTHLVMLVPVMPNVGITTIASGLLDALANKGVRATCLPEFDSEIVEKQLISNQLDDFLDNILEQYKIAADTNDIVILCGASLSIPYAPELNLKIATGLDATLIFVVAPGQSLPSSMRQLKIISTPYQEYKLNILGLIANKTNLQEVEIVKKYLDSFAINIQLRGMIPYKNELTERGVSFHNKTAISKYFDLNWLWPFLNNIVETRFTPTMFRSKLIFSARQANKRIVLPEGSEPRTLQAANICAEQGIARCVLLGKKQEIYNACAKIGLELNAKIEIIEPQNVIEKYVAPFCEVRRDKGLTPDEARKQLEDNATLGTMMLYLGDVDGLVSGAINTTANTIRPALQIIKSAPNVKLVSSVFFMCLPDQILVYGDCAINQNPNAEELADIAIESAKSAAAFGIAPRVAMLSYSTGNSGTGPDVEKIKTATSIVKLLQPNLAVDGPMQYDAAIDREVAQLKMPNSPVAGKATVFIAPNLNAGNIFYKAVQRSTGIVCVGPMLQGLRKPVNDLSRGCLVKDIVFTIAITAVQALECGI